MKTTPPKRKRGEKSGYRVFYSLGAWNVSFKGRDDIIPFDREKHARDAVARLKYGLSEWSDYRSFIP